MFCISRKRIQPRPPRLSTTTTRPPICTIGMIDPSICRWFRVEKGNPGTRSGGRGPLARAPGPVAAAAWGAPGLVHGDVWGAGLLPVGDAVLDLGLVVVGQRLPLPGEGAH